jgi:hypothetical protein
MRRVPTLAQDLRGRNAGNRNAECSGEKEKATVKVAFNAGVPKGIRTPVTAVKGQCPRPLDDRDYVWLQRVDLYSAGILLVEVSGIEPLTSCMPCKRSPS